MFFDITYNMYLAHPDSLNLKIYYCFMFCFSVQRPTLLAQHNPHEPNDQFHPSRLRLDRNTASTSFPRAGNLHMHLSHNSSSLFPPNKFLLDVCGRDVPLRLGGENVSWRPHKTPTLCHSRLGSPRRVYFNLVHRKSMEFVSRRPA